MDGGGDALRPDAELVATALGGEKDAFAELITRHWPTAVALAARLLGSADPGPGRGAGGDDRGPGRPGPAACPGPVRRLVLRHHAERGAAVVVDGPAGRQEVDARPSDAVNLALVTGAPVRVESALLDDPHAQAADHPQWQDFPVATSELAAEAQEEFRLGGEGWPEGGTGRAVIH